MDNLTISDVDILLEALSAWESKDAAGAMMVDMVSALITGVDPEAKAAEKVLREERRVKSERERTARNEASILLKAKLIGLKNEMEAEVLP